MLVAVIYDKLNDPTQGQGDLIIHKCTVLKAKYERGVNFLDTLIFCCRT